MYYIGCHWGNENDGYVCSSRRMKAAYKKRPQDFKKRILAKVYTNREDMLTEEHKWLQLIPTEELGKKYYNLLNHHFNHWSASEDERRLSIQERISQKTKQAMSRPEVREAFLEGVKNRNSISSPETCEKRRISMIKKMAEKFPSENRRKRLSRDSEELKELHRRNTTTLWQNPEYRKNIGNKISKILKGKPGRRLGHKSSPEHIEKIKKANLGKKRSAQVKQKYSEKQKGKKWWTDGTYEKRSLVCPDGWRAGRNDIYKQTTKKIWETRKLENNKI